jgi:hypothetical protein
MGYLRGHRLEPHFSAPPAKVVGIILVRRLGSASPDRKYRHPSPADCFSTNQIFARRHLVSFRGLRGTETTARIRVAYMLS